jgi:hypothetical protein
VESGETLGIRWRLATLFVVVAVFNFSLAKGGFVDFTW